MTTLYAHLCASSKRLLVGLLIVVCMVVPAIGTSAGAATPSTGIRDAAQARVERLAAPHVKVIGHKLIWPRVKGVSSYVLASQPLGHASAYRTIAKNSITPKPLPGATVRYRVKTDVKGSAWAHAVMITYTERASIVSSAASFKPTSKSGSGGGSSHHAGSGSGSGSGSRSGGGGSGSNGSGSGSSSSGSSSSGSGSSSSGSGSSSGASGVEEVTSKRAAALKVGLIGVQGWGSAASETIRKQTGVKYTRIDPGVEGWGPATELVAEGITPLALYNPGLDGMSPVAVAEGVKSYASHMRALGMTELELGNEVYYHGSTPAEYAAQYRAAHEALAGTGITLIANAWLDTQEPNGEWSQWESGGGWCVMFVQALGYVPDAWSFHPYGPMSADGFGSGAYGPGWATVPRMITYMKDDHIYAPLDITEVGQPTYQGTDGNAAVSEAEQAADIRQYLLQANEWGVASIYIYEAVDTEEGGYGLYSWPLKAKPSATVFAETLEQLST